MCGGMSGCGGGAPIGINGQIGQIQATIQGLQDGTVTEQQAKAVLGGNIVQQTGFTRPSVINGVLVDPSGNPMPAGSGPPNMDEMRGVMDPEFVPGNWGAKTPSQVALAKVFWSALEAPDASNRPSTRPTRAQLSAAWNGASAEDKAAILPTLKKALGFHLDSDLGQVDSPFFAKGDAQLRTFVSRAAHADIDVQAVTGITGTLQGNGGTSAPGPNGAYVYTPKTVDAASAATRLQTALTKYGL